MKAFLIILIVELIIVLPYWYIISLKFKGEMKSSKQCAHNDCTEVTVSSAVTCETIHTICDDCSEILNIRTDC